MSGLLDKANKTAAETTEEPKESSEAVLTDVTPVASGNGLNMNQLKFQIGSCIRIPCYNDTSVLHRQHRFVWRYHIR